MSNSILENLGDSVFAFRGYNVANLGRTAEFLQHDRFRSTMKDFLRRGSAICSETSGKRIDLEKRVREGRETELADYAESISLIVAVEQAQIQMLREFFDVQYEKARYAFGFSLGEISALVAGQVFKMEDALRIPLAMAQDGIEMAEGITLAVLFSRRDEISIEDIKRMIVEINLQGDGIVGMSTILSPNSILVLGSGESLERFRERIKTRYPKGVQLRKNEHLWPPLHTEMMWNRNVPNRSACLMRTLPGGTTSPTLPILSMVTGKMSYTDYNSREIIHQWIDHPQLLWDVVAETLSRAVETVIHVGPAPNIIPATFERLSSNVEAQTKGSRRMRALSAAVRRRWLASMLPKKSSLLRAPMVEHVILEDWLLAQKSR